MKVPVKQDDVSDIGLFKEALGLYEFDGPLVNAGKNLVTMRKVQVMLNSYQMSSEFFKNSDHIASKSFGLI